MAEQKPNKSTHATREERILAFWKENKIFEKTLEKKSPKGEFIFYEGPPTANGHPGIHHLEARAFKDAIPRYKTMQGYHVRRKGGWDTHGLPVELQVEKELGLKSKKEIEEYGLGKFNEKCKESVWKYVHEWEDFTDRMGYWVDLKDPYVTYHSNYIESLWNIVKTIDEKKLLYKDYKVVPWCPRCGTALSSHELAQGYEDVKDLAVTVKFKIKSQKSKLKVKSGEVSDYVPVYLLAWTTTPWTLPGNVGLAVGKDIEYLAIELENGFSENGVELSSGSYIVSKVALTHHLLHDKGKNDVNLFENILTSKGLNWLEGVEAEKPTHIQIIKGSDLVGLEYEPLFPYLKENTPDSEKDKLKNAYKVYAADFVNTEDGTGIVHTAVMYGQDDFELGTAVGLPKVHLVNEDGTFKKDMGYLSGRFVKEKDEKGKPTLDVEIIEDLKKRNLFFAQESYKHSYPHCWRCKTSLIYYARDSWYIKMSALRDDLVKGNKNIHWEPDYIKDGRFGEWLSEIKDWAISRERYWGTPLPVWVCDKCHQKKVIGSIAELGRRPRNNYWVMRHGEAENNTKSVINSIDENLYHLTEAGREMVKESSKKIEKTTVDLIFVSPLARTRETANILKEIFGWQDEQIIVDARLRELGFGAYEGRDSEEFDKDFPFANRFESMPSDGETYGKLKKRMGDFLYELESKFEGKNILIISHGTPSTMLLAAAQGLSPKNSIEYEMNKYVNKAEIRPVDFTILPHNSEYEIDLHRPHIDEVVLDCDCARSAGSGQGGKMKRVKEVMDVWFDSGAMPFAQDHYPFENKEYIDKTGYPADFISEAIDQTRGWFYTLHAIGILMGKSLAYKNVICLGHILDPEGKKMSKSVGNIVNPFEIMEKYGADAARFWMYSVNQPGESKNFDEKTVDEVVKKVFNLASNVLSFYLMYRGPLENSVAASDKSGNVIDRWILSRLAQLNKEVTDNLEAYKFLEPSRAIRDFIADLSQWYLRRSRDRFKNEGKDKVEALATTRFVLIELAKIMAPLTPFFAEELYKEAGGEKESVHLEEWPKTGKIDEKLLESMQIVRNLSSAGLEARMKAKINVRQPLSKLIVLERSDLSDTLIGLVKDEVNVKEVVFKDSITAEVELDTTMTPELIEEGQLREILRKIQDLRKEKGLSVGETARLTVTKDLHELISKNLDQIKKATGLVEIGFGDKFELR